MQLKDKLSSESAVRRLPFPTQFLGMTGWVWGSGATSAVDERRSQLQAWLSNVIGLRPADENVLEFLANDGSGKGAEPNSVSSLKLSTRISVSSTDTQADLMSPVGVYRCVRRTIIREGCESWSEKVGVLEQGEEVSALEERVNSDGVTRIRFKAAPTLATTSERGKQGGWCSLETQAGEQILVLTMKSVH